MVMKEASVYQRTLTVTDVRKLKAANGLRFIYEDGRAYIEAEILDGVYAGLHEIDVSCDLTGTITPGSTLICCSSSDPWVSGGVTKTAVDCMRSGDLVTLVWATQHAHRDLEIADLHRDELYIKITGGRQGKHKEFLFLNEVSITRDDQHRMIKYDTTANVLRLG